MKNRFAMTSRITNLFGYKYSPLLWGLLLILVACSKKEEPVDEPIDEYNYEVQCKSCEITYTDQSNTTKTVTHHQGKWTYRLDQKITFALKLSVITTPRTQQTIQAYIRKNDEIVSGNIGYHHSNISYNPKKAAGTANYGAHPGTGPGNGGSTGGNAKPTSSVCGAKNKTSGYCKRKVSGGGRCWQHS